MPTYLVRNQQAHSNWHFAATLLLACLAVGCGKSGSGSVSGKITFKDQPVVDGDVTFFQPSSGRVAQSPLSAEGTYSLNLSENPLPAGEFKVTVTPSTSYIEVAGPNGKDIKMVTKGEKSIPRPYRERNRTPLSATLTGGEDTFDFELK